MRKSKEELFHSDKDRSENVMVVDLVRNDLSKVCEEGTVKVDELYGIYSFPQVHQMISTVSGELKKNISFTEIIKATFPMGSMTGAPKKRVMELIEQYEKTKRGIFSGCLGYISPNGDFDFNVVIRSIMYNASSNYLSFQAGSAITFYSDPEKEWEECLLKAEAIKNCSILTNSMAIKGWTWELNRYSAFNNNCMDSFRISGFFAKKNIHFIIRQSQFIIAAGSYQSYQNRGSFY